MCPVLHPSRPLNIPGLVYPDPGQLWDCFPGARPCARYSLVPVPHPTHSIVYRSWNEILVRAQILGRTARPLVGGAPSFGSRHKSDSFCYRNWTENVEKIHGRGYFIYHSSLSCCLANLFLAAGAVFSFAPSHTVDVHILTDVHIQIYTHSHTPGAIKVLSLKIGLTDSACWGHLHCKLKIVFLGWG